MVLGFTYCGPQFFGGSTPDNLTCTNASLNPLGWFLVVLPLLAAGIAAAIGWERRQTVAIAVVAAVALVGGGAALAAVPLDAEPYVRWSGMTSTSYWLVVGDTGGASSASVCLEGDRCRKTEEHGGRDELQVLLPGDPAPGRPTVRARLRLCRLGVLCRTVVRDARIQRPAP